MSTIKLTKVELQNALDDAIEGELDTWRWGHVQQFIIEKDGKHYSVWVRIHIEDGWQLDDDTYILPEVEKVQEMVDVWRKKKNDS